MMWWQKEHKSRYPRIRQDTKVHVGEGVYKSITQGCFINPVRAAYLPQGHFWTTRFVNEEEEMVAETPVGFGVVELKDIEW